MLGGFEALLSFLTRQIGLMTDTADAAGSLHAKAKDIKNTVSALPVYPLGNTTPAFWNASGQVGTTETDILLVNGAGFMTSAEISVGTNDTTKLGTATVKIYLDGILRKTDSLSAPAYSDMSYYDLKNFFWRFKTSLRITVQSPSANYGIRYSLDARGFLD